MDRRISERATGGDCLTAKGSWWKRLAAALERMRRRWLPHTKAFRVGAGVQAEILFELWFRQGGDRFVEADEVAAAVRHVAANHPERETLEASAEAFLVKVNESIRPTARRPAPAAPSAAARQRANRYYETRYGRSRSVPRSDSRRAA